MTSLRHAVLAARAHHDKLVIDGVYNDIASDGEYVDPYVGEDTTVLVPTVDHRPQRIEGLHV